MFNVLATHTHKIDRLNNSKTSEQLYRIWCHPVHSMHQNAYKRHGLGRVKRSLKLSWRLRLMNVHRILTRWACRVTYFGFELFNFFYFDICIKTSPNLHFIDKINSNQWWKTLNFQSILQIFRYLLRFSMIFLFNAFFVNLEIQSTVTSYSIHAWK